MKIKSSPIARPISNMMFNIEMENIIIKPSFQRDYVWKELSIKDSLMKSIFLGFPIGVFTIWVDENGKENIVDGLQRIITIKSFYNQEEDQYYKIGTKISREIVDQYFSEIMLSANKGDRNSKQVVNLVNANRGFTLRNDNLPDPLRQILDSYALNINSISNARPNQIRNYFRVVQNQEKLKAGEIIRSIDSNQMVDLIKSHMNLSKQFKEITFNNDRHDFTKYCISWHGISNNKLKLGVADKEIVKYGEKMQMSNFEIDAYEKFFKLLENCDFTINEYQRQFNKYAMKLLIAYSISNLDKLDSQRLVDIVQKLYDVIADLSKLNSINEDNKKHIYSKKYIKELEYLSRLSRTTHSFEQVKEGLEYLENILESLNANEIRKLYIFEYRFQPSMNLKTKRNGLKEKYIKNYNNLKERTLTKFKEMSKVK